jgi:hypothetical protein
MASKAAKLRNKRMRGRPCKEGVARTEGGRISRAAEPGEAPDVLARRTRIRLHGVNENRPNGIREEDASQPEAGTFIGRLKLTGVLSAPQYEALIRYQMTRERFLIAINAPDSLATRSGGVMSIPDPESDKKAVAAWEAVLDTIRRAQTYERGNLMAALNFLVSRDEEHHHMVGDLRVVGNALCRHYGIDAMPKSA